MKINKRIFSGFLLGTLIASLTFFNSNVFAQTIKKGWNGDFYYKENGTMAKNEWVKYDKNQRWYFLKEDGKYARDGWLKIKNKFYYFTNYGDMAENEWILDGKSWYFINKNGDYLQNDWLLYKGKWYFFKPGGRMAENEWIFYNKNKKWYFFNDDGTMATDWLKQNNNYYFLNSFGDMATGWKLIRNKWYFFNDSGIMFSKKWTYYKNKWYFLKENGNMATDQFVDNYYLKSDGTMAVSESIDIFVTSQKATFDSNGKAIYTSIFDNVDNTDKKYVIYNQNNKALEITGHFDNELSNQLIDILNEYRVKNKLPKLSINKELMRAANLRATEIVLISEHTRTNDKSFDTAINLSLTNGLNNFDENIGIGYTTVKELIYDWSKNPKTNFNLLNSKHTNAGVGMFKFKIGENKYIPAYVLLTGH